MLYCRTELGPDPAHDMTRVFGRTNRTRIFFGPELDPS